MRIVNRPRDRAERARRFVEKQAPEVRARLGLSPDGAGGVEVATATDRRPRYGLVPFRVRCESVGFIFNRIWAAIKREALMVVHEGVATHKDVDRIWREAFGTAAAPFRMIDQVGLDVALDIEEHYAAIRDGVPEGPRRLLREYVHRGHLGVKAGRGFYADYGAPDSYENTTLPGYLFAVDDSGAARPTVIYTNGYDSTAEEAWFAIAAAAIDRGYNVLAYDGPGQGAVIREQGLKFRPDWEAVLGPVLDYALELPEVDADAIAHFGYSLGGYLVARAAAFDDRAAALILDDGLYDFHQAYRNAVPALLMKLVYARRDRIPNLLTGLLARVDRQERWGLGNGVWTIGGNSHADFLRRTTEYSLAGLADRITTPALIMDAEADQFLKGQPDALAANMTAPTTMAYLTSAEGAGEHCHVGSLVRAHQVIFDWLDEILRRPPLRRTMAAA